MTTRNAWFPGRGSIPASRADELKLGDHVLLGSRYDRRFEVVGIDLYEGRYRIGLRHADYEATVWEWASPGHLYAKSW